MYCYHLLIHGYAGIYKLPFRRRYIMRPAHETSVWLTGGPYRYGSCPVSETKRVCTWCIQNFHFDRVAVYLLVRFPQRGEQSCCFTLLVRLRQRGEFSVQPACSRESIAHASCFMKRVYKTVYSPRGEFNLLAPPMGYLLSRHLALWLQLGLELGVGRSFLKALGRGKDEGYDVDRKFSLFITL